MRYRIFIASSMRNSCSKLVGDIINKVNMRLEIVDIQFELIRYSETPIVDHESDTQRILYHEVATSDILIVLADNNIPIGEYTLGEYQTAHNQSLRSVSKRPYIKVFTLYNQDDENKNIGYKKDGVILDFESKVFSDSKRYIQFLLRSEFCDFFEKWLMKEALYGLGNNIKQNELSYGDHLHRIGQGGIREEKNKYYRRDKLDGQIERVLKASPVIILEGNTYSGKTRAAFEYMKNCEEWEEYDFHIYDNCSFVKDLNGIRALDYSGNNRGDVFFFDDVNDILKRNDEPINRALPLWSKLNGYNKLKGFSLDDFGKTRIIFTVSGKLSASQKSSIYNQIFNNDSAIFRTNLERIIINFDIYDPSSFRQVVNAMIREGMLTKACVRPGNYTIGSLFINMEYIRAEVERQYERDKTLMLTLVAHFKYAQKSRFTGLQNEIQRLYDFIDKASCGNIKKLEDGIERLRQKGLVVVTKVDNDLYKIFIDKYILDVFNEVVLKNIRSKKNTGSYVLNKILIDYAMMCQNSRKREDNLANYHIGYVAQMAYLLIDRNKLRDQEIIELIEIVASALFPNKKYNQKKREDVLIITKLVDIISLPGHYHRIFSSSSIANIKDFKRVETLLDICYEYYEFCIAKSLKGKSERSIELYKQIIYAMLSPENRVMTMAQEQQILNLMLDSRGDWRAPFSEDDLKDVFNLTRLIAYVKKLGVQKIIELLPTVNPDRYDDVYINDNKTNIDENAVENDDDFGESASSSVLVVESDGFYEKVFLKQLSNAAITAIRCIDNFDDFMKTVDKLRIIYDKSIHVKRAVERFSTYDFYRIIPEITKKMNYINRKFLFNFIFSIDDASGVLGNFLVKEEYLDQFRESRIHSLNELLVYLDENAALEGYKKMIDNGLCDMETLSHLLKNEFLNFEQILRLVGKDDGQSNFITLNQLMGKAETLSDADMCMRLMGIVNCDPCKIRDENALANYLQIKYIDCRRCIEIIKKRRLLFRDTLSDAMISIILKKFDIKQLIDIFFPSEKNMAQGYYWEHYGFLDEEIESMRKNAIHLNIFFIKANTCGKEISELVKRKFEEIIQNKETRLLITDSQCNSNNAILSVYMKNRYLFYSYERVRCFYDNLPVECKPKEVNHYIFGVFLWDIVNAYKNGAYDCSKAIKLLNKELIVAYEEFAKYYTKDLVINMMAKLYSYRPLLTNEFSFSEIEEYAYEDQILRMTFKDYLKYLIKNNPVFADGTFIFHALTIMKKQVNNEIYDLLATLSSINHTGVKYDTEIKNGDRNNPILSQEIRQKLFDIGSNTLKIDFRLVHNVSYIKVLWFLLYNELMTLDKAEEYRKKNNIPITETYLNLVLKHIEQNTLKKWKNSKCRNGVLEDGYNQMIDYMRRMFLTGGIYIHKSIQMCLSLIAVAPNEKLLNQIFEDDEFREFENKAEVIAARMNNLLRLRYKSNKASYTLLEFKEMILMNCRSINIWIINIYLSTFVKIDKYELLGKNNVEDRPFIRCWTLLKEEGKIDVFELLNVDEKRKIDIVEQIGLHERKWILDANVQTFSYFTQSSPKLISIMDTLYNGNFTYDYTGKKSCLKDVLKNYSFTYDNYELDITEVSRISEILLRKENRKIFKEICDEYILTSSYKKNSKKWNVISNLWKDLLFNPSFRVALVHYVCKIDTVGKSFRLNKLTSLDTERIEILQKALCLDNFDDAVRHEVIDYYNRLRNLSGEIGSKLMCENAELINLIFQVSKRK